MSNVRPNPQALQNGELQVKDDKKMGKFSCNFENLRLCRVILRKELIFQSLLKRLNIKKAKNKKLKNAQYRKNLT